MLNSRQHLSALLRGSLLARGGGAMCGMLLQIAVARLLGIESTGSLYSAIIVITVFAIVGKGGLDAILIRESSTSWHAGDRALVGRLFGQALSAGLLTSIGLSLLLFVASDWIATAVFRDPQLHSIISWCASIIPLQTAIWLQSAMLKVQDRPARSTLLEIALVPATTLAIAIGLKLIGELDLEGFVRAYTLSHAACSIIGFGLLCRAGSARAVMAGLMRPRWPRSRWDLTGVELLSFALSSAALPVLSAVSDAEQAGLLNAALRLTAQVGMVGIIVGGLLAPRFAALYQAGGSSVELQKLARLGSRWMLGLGSPILAVFLVFPESGLLLFGADFQAFCTPLRILAVGQFVNMLTGPAGYLMVMVQMERELRDITALTVALTLPAAAVLGNRWGADGAAIACAGGLMLQNMAAVIALYRSRGICTLPWGAPVQRDLPEPLSAAAH